MSQDQPGTDRDRPSQAAHASVDNLRSLLHNATDFALYRIAVDPTQPHLARVVLVSPSLSDITGIDDPYRFESWFENLHPDDGERIIAANQRAFAERTSYDQVARFYHAGKEDWVWVHTVSTPILDEQGRLTHFDGLVIDITEQKQTEQALQRQRAFENLVTSISTRFINLDLDHIDQGIADALRSVGEFTNVDRSYLFGFSPDRTHFSCTHEWSAPAVEPQIDGLQHLLVADWAWSNDQILDGHILHIPSVADLPPQANPEKREFERQGIQSLLAVPMIYRGTVYGFLGFDAVRTAKTWSRQDMTLLQIVGEVFVNALQHKRAQETLQRAYQSLEQRVEDRTHELATLLRLSHEMVSTLDLDSLLGIVLDRLGTVVDYDGASILTLDDDVLHITAYRGPLDQEQALAIRFPLDTVPIDRAVIERQAPVIVPDTRGSADVERLFQISAGDELTTTYAYIRSWIGLPLIVKGHVIGMLTLDHAQPGTYNEEHAHTAMAFANQAAVSIENARLYQAEQARLHESEQRRQVAESLRDIVGAINANLPLQAILERIVEQAAQHLDAAACLLSHIDLDTNEIVHQATYGWPSELHDKNVIPNGLHAHAGSEGYRRAMLQRQVVYGNYAPLPDRVREIERDPAIPPEIKARRILIRTHFAASMAVPLLLDDKVYGGLAFYYAKPQAFAQEQIELALTFSEQAALAIQNARLREQAAKSATQAERNRLARDLHDAVTQTLFSASLIAEVLPRIWERNPEDGRQRLNELRELTRGALAEMRTLLLELRPAALVEAKLADLIRQLGEATVGRARLEIDLQVQDVDPLPAEVKVALYRIIQEAINNVVKHAQAQHVTVTLQRNDGKIMLRIVDDGRGFDRDRIPSDHFGLGNMRERAEAIGAQLDIESEPGIGTEIQVHWENASSP